MTLPEALQPLHTFFMIVSFALGCMVGSFCNVCICRWPAGESVVAPRSRCPKCLNSIAWYDNIPILSWLFLGAKCRHCGQAISWQYPLVEGLTGVLFLLVYGRFGITAATPVYMALAAALVVVVFQDLTDWTIPNEITLPGIPIAIGLALLGMIYPGSGLRVTDPIDAFDGIVLGGFIICLLDGIVVLLLHKPGMGFGDMKLLALLGAFLGWHGVLGALMLASLLGSVVGVSMIAYFHFQRSGEAETAEEEEEELPAAPVDPLASIILAAATLYLLIRVLVFFRVEPGSLLEEAAQFIRYGMAALALLGFGVSGVSLYVYTRRRTAETGPGEAVGAPPMTEEDISLRNHYLPFGPYLAVAGLLFLFFGPEVINLYFSLSR